MNSAEVVKNLNFLSDLEAFHWALYLNGKDKEVNKKASDFFRKEFNQLYNMFLKCGGSLRVSCLVSMYEQDTPYSFEKFEVVKEMTSC